VIPKIKRRRTATKLPKSKLSSVVENLAATLAYDVPVLPIPPQNEGADLKSKLHET
jgi:hypothetical protein